MAYTQSDLDAIDRAIATGTRRVTVDGRSVEYRDVAEMMRVRDLIKRDLGQTAGSTRRYGTYSKGL